MTNTKTQKFDKELETIKIKDSQIFDKEITILTFPSMDLVIDTKNMEITEESFDSLDSTSRYTDSIEFTEAIKSYVWMFNN